MIALKINPDADMTKWNMGWSYSILVSFSEDSKKGNRDIFHAGSEKFKQFFVINQNVADAYMDYARLHYLYLSGLKLTDEAFGPTLRTGLQAVQQCGQVQPGAHHGCMAVEGLLLSLQGQQQAAQRQAPLPTLAKALERARGARAGAPKDSTVLLAVAETCLRLAEIKAGLGQPATSELREGLLSAEQTLKVAAGWPRALAIQGALWVLSARGARLGPEQRATLQRAQAALKAGFAGSPLLKNRYGAALSEAETRLAELH